ncbi:MAG: hypothetical protein GXO90_05000 [FCB group bacterium]|nr:hypothetical protein [FCB group bacterium]
MSNTVYHIGTAVFSDDPQFRQHLRDLKTALFGDGQSATAMTGALNSVQLTIETDLSLEEFSHDSLAALNRLRETLEIAQEEGFAVHLTLDVSVLPENGWLNQTWTDRVWEHAGEFLPYQPCKERNEGGVICPYDLIFEHYQVPVIQFLKAENILNTVAVIYVMNEPGYSASAEDDSTNWGYRQDWEIYRSQALVNTAARGLNLTRTATGGQTPVGIKFSDVIDPNKGWGIIDDYDPLADILQNIMAPSGDLVAFDAYWSEGVEPYSIEFYHRFSPFLSLFNDGRFVIEEYGKDCEGSPGVFLSGTRITTDEMLGLLNAWPESRGFIHYAYNSTDCFSLTDPESGALLNSAQEVLNGMRQQMEIIVGIDGE